MLSNFLFGLILVFADSAAFAAESSWRGGDAANLASTAANWTGGAVPASGDALVLPSGATVNWDLSGIVPT